jgi:hypothetical protein
MAETERTILLSNETYQAVAALAVLPFHSTGTQLSNGDWIVPISEETWERIDAFRLRQESDEQLVARLMRRYQGKKPS